MKCQQMLNIEERQEEYGNYLKLVRMAKKISLPGFIDEINLCHRFETTLRKVKNGNFKLYLYFSL